MNKLSKLEISPRVATNRYRHTKIVATLGPATESKEQLSRLILAGVDVMRLNMAHASQQWVADTIWHIREVSTAVGREVAIMMDVKGPEIRTGPLDVSIKLNVGDQLEFVTSKDEGRDIGAITRVSVNYPGLPDDVDVGATILVDSGLMKLRVVEKGSTHVRCVTLTEGELGSRRHINLPGIRVNLPALTEKDNTDLQCGVAAGLDFVALSFVRQAVDVLELRKLLDDLGSKAKIVAKIEDQAGVRNMHSIIQAADAIMVARGDLGIEIDYHKLPLVQTELVRACHAAGKPVIIATHLLESMINSPMPTRAEISDVSNAIREQADAVMLSGETTTGAYPLESVEVLLNIINSIEPSVDGKINSTIELKTPKDKMLRSAAVLAQELGDSGIVVFTHSGYLGNTLAALRACGVPIFAFTDVDTVFRQLMLAWGVEPFLIEFSDDPETTILNALNYLKRQGWTQSGTWQVVITNALANEKIIDTLQLRQIE
jgi:pyruvate kinase